MLNIEDKSNMRIKNNLIPELKLNSNFFKKVHESELSTKEQVARENNSISSNEDDKKLNTFPNENNLLSSRLNSTNNNIIENIDSKNNNNPQIIYEKIKSNIDKFINDYSNEKETLNYILKEILNATVIIIKDFIETKYNNSSSSIDNKQNEILFLTEEPQNRQNLKLSNIELDINSKIVFLLQIQKLNDKINKLKEEIDFYKNIINEHRKSKFGKNFADIFKKKIFEQRSKNKKEEFKYLLCIGEQEKKINNLENKLKKKENENLPAETIKSFRCFPNFHQYDFKEDLNPKSIPMFSNSKNDKNRRSINSTSSKIDNINKKNRTQLNLTNLGFDKIKKNSKYISCETNKQTKKGKVFNSNKLRNNDMTLTIYNFNKYAHTLDDTLSNSQQNKNKTINYGIKDKNIFDLVKDYHPKTILDNKKEFFLAHPNLDTAGIIKKKERKYVGIPKKLLKLKVHKNLEKNIQITFPSYFNETMVNLEKLRKCRNIKVNESEF
jgi:hypothetical protein